MIIELNDDDTRLLYTALLLEQAPEHLSYEDTPSSRETIRTGDQIRAPR
jgi:hypothetical protein